MGQVMVNFRMDEDTKRSMELACREMGLSMTAAFTIFAKKVGKEKRIPFEIAAEPYPGRTARPESGRDGWEERLGQRRERLERMCAEIRRSLTSIHVAIPAAITGLPMERIRLLCGDELKDKTAAAAGAVRALGSGPAAGLLRDKDWGILDEYTDGLASIAEELAQIERALVPSMRSWSGGDAGGFEAYERRLAGASREFDALADVMGRFLSSTAAVGARAVEARVRQAARGVETAYVLTALERLNGLIGRDYGLLDDQARTRLESDYLRTLELALRELGRAERNGGDAGAKAALCLRVVNVLSEVILDSRRARQEWDERSLEAEVTALERLAAMRGDIGGGVKMEN